MNIQPISFKGIHLLGNKFSRNVFSERKDVFLKNTQTQNSTNTTDSGYNEFEKFFIQMLGDKKCIDLQGKILGSGFEGSVYEMLGTDKWVIKLSKRSTYIPVALDKPEILEIHDDFPDLNIGQPIAKVTMPVHENYSKTFYVLRKQKGQSLGVYLDRIDYIDEYMQKVHIKSLELLACAPQKTYDKLIRDISRLSEKGYEIDCGNPNNFMFDEDSQTINFVDVNMFEAGAENTNQYGNVLYSLLDTQFEKLQRQDDQNDFTINKRTKLITQICHKYFNAMVKYNKKFDLKNWFLSLFCSSMLDQALNAQSDSDKIDVLHKKHLL